MTLIESKQGTGDMLGMPQGSLGDMRIYALDREPYRVYARDKGHLRDVPGDPLGTWGYMLGTGP